MICINNKYVIGNDIILRYIVTYDVNDTNSVRIILARIRLMTKYRIPTSDKQTNKNNIINDPGSFIISGR